jgi:outer membrane protein
MTILSFLRMSALTITAVAIGAFSAHADTPVAVIDLAKIIEDSSAGKDLQAKFKSKKESLQKEAVSYENDLKSKEQTLLKDKKSLDDKAFAAKKKSFETDLKKKRQEILTKNMDLEKSKNDALKTIQSKVAQIAADIADEKKIQVVLDRTAVVIAQQSLDITGEVITKLDSTLKTVSLK